jgi:outer membrane receptor protein involved in Fe transport
MGDVFGASALQPTQAVRRKKFELTQTMQEMRMANHNLTRAVRLALLAAGATGAGAYVSGAAAQDAALEQVVVTGSRIATTGIESPSPLQIVGAQDIDSSGVANIQDLLLQNPAFGTPTISRTNSNFQTSSAGVATIDLRNLGESRTLVLVNGRRFVAGIPGESAVDLNTIPQQFIERVEILTGGASSVYGSDAVAGVVNIIYKKDFEGVELEGQYGGSAESDDHETQVGLTMGTSTADGRGNIMVHAGYTDQGAVFSRDRSRSAVDQFSKGYLYSTADDLFVPYRPFYSSYTPQGRFSTTGGVFTYSPDNDLELGFDTNGSAGGPARGFNRSSKRTIAVPTERYLFATQGSYEYMEGHRAFIEGTYASTQAISELEPFPLDSSEIFPVDAQMPLESLVDGVMVKNPIVPQQIYDAATDVNGDGRRDLSFRRRLSEVGNRGSTGGSRHVPRARWFRRRDSGRRELEVRGVLRLRPDEGSPDLRWAGQRPELPQRARSGRGCQRHRRRRRHGRSDLRERRCARRGLRADRHLRPQLDLGLRPDAYVNAPSSLATFTSQKLAGLNLTGDCHRPAGGSARRGRWSRVSG